MKIKLFTIILLTLFINSCSSVKYLKDTDATDKKAMKSFLKELKEVALSKHYTLLMDYMDEDYVKEEHDDILGGNDLQFVDEIFCGGIELNSKDYHCIAQKNITFFEVQEVSQLEDSKYKALFLVGDDSIKIYCKLLISKKVVDGKVKFGIVGAVG